MNASEFGTELGKLVERAVADGVLKRKMSVEELVGCLELQKLEVSRHFQDLARAAAQNKRPTIVRPNGFNLPPAPGA